MLCNRQIIFKLCLSDLFSIKEILISIFYKNPLSLAFIRDLRDKIHLMCSRSIKKSEIEIEWREFVLERVMIWFPDATTKMNFSIIVARLRRQKEKNTRGNGTKKAITRVCRYFSRSHSRVKTIQRMCYKKRFKLEWRV